MNYENIQFTVEGGIARLTLNRPDKLNSFTDAMHAELRDALDAIQSGRGEAAAARVLVLSGAGRGFSAGQDLGEMADPSVFADREPGYHRFMPVLEAFPKPVIAAVNGVGVGIGLTMLLHCDLVLMARSARINSSTRTGLVT